MELKFREYNNSFANEVRDIISSYDNQPFTIHNVFCDACKSNNLTQSDTMYNKVRYSVYYLHNAGELEALRREKNATVFRAITEDKYVHFKE